MMDSTITTMRASFAQIIPILKSQGKDNIIHSISESLDNINKGSSTVLVCGEFKRGKSSLINALIGKQLCPSDTEICTAAVNIIKFGEQPKAIRIFGDFSNLQKEEIPFDEIKDYTIWSDDRTFQDTICLEISVPLDELKNGLILIDTPGVGGLDPRHAVLTNYFLPRADIALFMTDVNEPLTTTELDFLKKKVLEFAKQCVVVVGKSDLKTKEDVEDILNDTKSKICSYCQMEADDFSIIDVSALECIDEEEGLGNIPKLKHIISQNASELKRMQLKSLSDEILEQIDMAIMPIQAQIKEIEKPDMSEYKKLEQEKNAIDKRLSELQDSSSSFRKEISQILNEEQEKLSNWITNVSTDLTNTTLNKLMEDRRALDSETGNQWVGQQLNKKIDEISSEVSNMLTKAFERIAGMKEFEGVLNVEPRQFSGQISIQNSKLTVPVHKRVLSSMPAYGISMMGLYLLSANPIGIVAMLGLGGYVAYKNSEDTGKVIKTTEIRKWYLPELTKISSNLRTHVSNRFHEFQNDWLRAITERCKDYKENLSKTIMAIQTIRADINKKVNLKSQLQMRLRPLLEAKINLSKTNI